jgi:hypothetical protein
MPFGSVPDKTEAKCITSRPSPRAGLVLGPNQEKHFVPARGSPTIGKTAHAASSSAISVDSVFLISAFRNHLFPPADSIWSDPGGSHMSGQVVLYFDDQSDALRFALAAGSVMAGDAPAADLMQKDLVQKTARISRIRLNASNGGKSKPSPPDRAV